MKKLHWERSSGYPFEWTTRSKGLLSSDVFVETTMRIKGGAMRKILCHACQECDILEKNVMRAAKAIGDRLIITALL